MALLAVIPANKPVLLRIPSLRGGRSRFDAAIQLLSPAKKLDCRGLTLRGLAMTTDPLINR